MGKIEKVETQRDPRRVALGEAIANHNERSRAFDAAKAAVARANTLVDAAETRHQLAKAGLAAWRTNQVERLHAAAATGEELPQESGRAARAAAEDAADEIESAKSVLVDCMAARTEAEKALQWAVLRLESAVAPVLTSEVASLIAQATSLREEYHEKCAALTWLKDQLLPGGDERERINAVPPPPEWVAAQEALRTNPDAPLPT